MNVCIIPARGGSKGIPRKNLVELCGKPLVVWSIEQALAARQVDRVIVSSDCREIGEIAIEAGAEWMLRSDDTASDTATTESAIFEVLDTIGDPEMVILLQATSPIRQPGDIDGAIDALHDAPADSCFSARFIEGYTWTCGEILTPNYGNRQRRQCQPVARLEENGSIYVFTPDVLRTHNQRIGGRVTFHEMHPLDSFQIDVPSDLELFEVLIPLRLRQSTYSVISTVCSVPSQTGTMTEHNRYEETLHD